MTFTNDQTAALFEAAEKGDFQLIATLLQDGADPNCTRPDGDTPLHIAIRDNKGYTEYECVRNLLQHGSEVDRINAQGESPLYLATAKEVTYCVIELLEAGAAPEPKGGKSILPACANHRCADIAAKLLRAGANPLAVNSEGKTLLDLAREAGNKRLVSLMELYFRTKGFTQFRTDEILDATLCAPLDVLEKLLQDGADPNVEDKYGDTPFRYAACAYYEHSERERLLVRYGADYCGRDKYGVAFILNWIDSADCESRCHEVAELLQGVDVNRLDKRGCNLLHYAVYDGCYHVVKSLLEIGADPSVRTAKGGLPLEIALGRVEDDNDGHDKIVDLLRPISPEPRQPLPRRLGHELVCAAQEGDKAAIRNLLAAGAPPDGDDWGILSIYGFGTIPLIEFAEYRGDVSSQRELAEITRILVEAGADVNLSKFDHYSPLHAAALCDATGIIRVLLESGADASACDDQDGAPLDLAEHFGNKRAARLLRQWMKEHNIKIE